MIYKTLKIIILFIIISNNIQAQEDPPLWFTDDFINNVNRWSMIKEFGEKVYHNALFVNTDKDFRLVAEFNSKELKEYAHWGLSWARKNAYKFYHFEINNKQEFRIGYQKDANFNIIEPWNKKQKIIDADYNILEIRKTGNDLFFFINEKLVYKMPHRHFANTGLALKSTSTDVEFKRISIFQDMGKINLVEGADFAPNTTVQNLGNKVNSKYVDKSPTISPDGKTLYFVREDAADGFGGQDIYVSNRSEDGIWSEAQNIGRPMNNDGHNFVNAVMPDNNTLMAINSYTRTDFEQILAFAHRTKEGWSAPNIKSINRLQNIGTWVSFSLAADGQTIVFSMERPDSYGGRDLYVSFLQADGNFSSPRNLGATLNTPGNEHSPFLAADGRTLYFDTDGHPGYGGRDIFMSKRLDDSWTNWESPNNLGPIINTKGADEGFVIPASGEEAYFVSDKDSYGGYDIFSLPIPKALRPDPIALINGYIVDCQSLTGIPTSILIYKDGQLSESATARSSPVDGAFKLALATGSKYMIVAVHNSELESGFNDTIQLDLTKLEAYEEREIEPICFQKKSKTKENSIIPIRAMYSPFEKSVYYVRNQ